MADIRSELKNAMLENMANDPSSGVLKKGRVIFNSTSGKARMYNGATWEDLGSGGGGVATAPAGEYIDCTDKPRAVCLSEKACIEIPTGKYIDLDEGSGEISIDCSSLAGTYFLFDLDTSGDEFDFTESLQTLLNDNVSTTITYNVSYDKSTRKITIADNAASTNFTLKWSTGTNTANTIGEYLGFTISADDSGANTYTADSEIIESAGYDTKTFIFMTDADYLVKSRNYLGFVDTNTEKMAIATAKFMTEVDYAGIDDGKRYFTKSAAITVETGVNDKIDFKENGGSEVTATIAAGTYFYGADSEQGYVSFCAAVKTALDAAGATYNVSFNKGTQKFTLDPTTGTTQFLWNTGTNAATCARDELGFDNADTIDAAIHESDNPVVYAGNIVVAGDETSTESVFVGVGLEEKVLAKQNFSLSEYDDIYSAPGDWLATPEEMTFTAGSNGIQHHCTDLSSNGYGLKLYTDNNTGANSLYRVRYKTPNGVWTDATTTIGRGTPGNSVATDNFRSGVYPERSRCAVDENGHGVLALARYNTTNNKYEVWEYHSTDLITWTGNVINDSPSYSSYVGDLKIRENKACILINRDDNASSLIFISNNSGSGYSSWSSAIGLTNDYVYNAPSGIEIQYFPEQSGINQYRIFTTGRRISGTNGYAYFKGDGTVEVTGIGIDVNCHLLGIGRSKTGNGNRIVYFCIDDSTNAILYEVDTNDVYNTGTLTLDNHSKADRLPSGTVLAYYGYTSASHQNFIWNTENRVVVIDKAAYFVINHNGTGLILAYLIYSKDVTSGVWETPIHIGDTSGTSPQDQEECLVYVPSVNTMLAGTKKISGSTTGNLTEGEIFVTEIELLGDGGVVVRTPEKIDGGEAADTNFNGYFTLAASANAAIAVFEHNTGVNNKLWWNEYK